MLNLPLISIAVCTFNGERHLHKQLESLVHQTYPFKEIIIVDDFSTDNTFNILLKYQNKYPFVKVYQNEFNLGYIKNFQKALSNCNGEFITLSDQDDIWNKQKLSTLISTIMDNDIMIYHNSALINEYGVSLNKCLSSVIGYISGKANRNLLLNNCIAGHAMMFRKSLFSYLFPFPSTIPHDHWIAYIALSIGNVRYLNQNLVEYRQHKTSITSTLHLKDNSGIEYKKINKNYDRIRIDEERIKHLKALKTFKGNSLKDKKFIKTLIKYMSHKKNQLFSIKLFIFMIWNQSSLFKLYHKSFFSTITLIFKECKK